MVIKKFTSPQAFEMLKRVSYLELLLKCVSEKKGINFNELVEKLKDVQHFYYLNDEDVAYREIVEKEGNKTRNEIAKEKIMKVLEGL